VGLSIVIYSRRWDLYLYRGMYIVSVEATFLPVDRPVLKIICFSLFLPIKRNRRGNKE